MIRDTLKNILSSRFPPTVLENVVDALLDDGNPLHLDDQGAVLLTGIDLVRNNKDQHKVNLGWRILRILQRKPDVDFNILVNADIIKNLFIGTEPPNNPQEVLPLVDWCLQRSCNLDLETIVQHCLIGYLHSVSVDDKLLAEVCMFLSSHPICLPVGDELKKFCEAVVVCLSSFAMPAAQAEAVKEIKESISKIEDFLNNILRNKWERKNIVHSCLHIVYTAITNEEDDREPFPGLAVVLGLLDRKAIEKEVQTVLNGNSSHKAVKKALQIFCHWLSVWPRAAHVNLWVYALIAELEIREMYDILMEVTFETIDKLFRALQFPILRHSVEIVVWRMLYANVYNREIFHKISGNIPSVMNQLMLDRAKTSLNSLYNYCYLIKEDFPKFSEDYPAVNKAIECFPRHKIFKKSQLGIKQWCPPMEGCTPAIEMVSAYHPTQSASTYQFTEAVTAYQPTGRVGLRNLGNTCYMNSVLQGLFMTNRFCFGLLSKEKNCSQQIICKLQALFALLLHSMRPALSPTDLLATCRPPGFLPGHQQDSSEFLTYLLNMLHEQEAKVGKHESNEAIGPVLNMEVNSGGCGDGKQEENCTGPISRWTTEENLSGGATLERKAHSLADCTQGGSESEKTEILSSTLSGSADSGIHSVCGDEAGAVVTLAELPNYHLSLVHETFGGKMVTCNKCLTCNSESIHTDTFTDLQLSFPPQEEDTNNETLDVQKLFNYFVSAEKLTGDNCYRCDKCSALTVGQRSLNILQAPSHLILTIKHFHYDSTTMQRTKLLHKVDYNEQLSVPVAGAGQQLSHHETYNLYAAVVHSGRSVDSGHYYTFSQDQSGNWFVFNDELVHLSSLNELRNLEAADTPYILFYAKLNETLQLAAGSHSVDNLQAHLQEIVAGDNALYSEQKKEERRKSFMGAVSRTWYNQRKPDDDPPSSCGGGTSFSTSANREIF